MTFVKKNKKIVPKLFKSAQHKIFFRNEQLYQCFEFSDGKSPHCYFFKSCQTRISPHSHSTQPKICHSKQVHVLKTIKLINQPIVFSFDKICYHHSFSSTSNVDFLRKSQPAARLFIHDMLRKKDDPKKKRNGTLSTLTLLLIGARLPNCMLRYHSYIRQKKSLIKFA